MKNKFTPVTFIAAVLLSLAMVTAYELYWRQAEGWVPGYDDNADVWAYWRGQVDGLTANDVLIVGSSRAHFDINLHLFDSLTGRRPVTLAIPGGSPYYTLEDIVNKTDFKGLLIIGVAPGLFYTLGTGGSAMWVKEGRVDYYYKQTYAAKFNQTIYNCIDPYFSYLDPDLSLKSLVTRIPLPKRDSVETPPAWPPMVHMDKYRNVRMNERFETDTVLQNRQKKIWDGDWKNQYTDSAEVILNHYATLVQTFTKRGGRAVFIQAPVTGKYLHYEPLLFPREKYWDVLLSKANVKGYCYEDYPEMKAMNPPEWSHLNRKDADEFTRILVRLLKEDDLLP